MSTEHWAERWERKETIFACLLSHHSSLLDWPMGTKNKTECSAECATCFSTRQRISSASKVRSDKCLLSITSRQSEALRKDLNQRLLYAIIGVTWDFTTKQCIIACMPICLSHKFSWYYVLCYATYYAAINSIFVCQIINFINSMGWEQLSVIFN